MLVFRNQKALVLKSQEHLLDNDLHYVSDGFNINRAKLYKWVDRDWVVIAIGEDAYKVWRQMCVAPDPQPESYGGF